MECAGDDPWEVPVGGVTVVHLTIGAYLVDLPLEFTSGHVPEGSNDGPHEAWEVHLPDHTVIMGMPDAPAVFGPESRGRPRSGSPQIDRGVRLSGPVADAQRLVE